MSGPSFFVFEGDVYPDYLRRGNAMQYIAPTALQYCVGRGLDVGCSEWPLPGAIGVELRQGGDAYAVPRDPDALGWDYVFSSHCLEHLADPIRALEHWIDVLRPGGSLFLYLPHPAQKYWRPERCRKHLHSWEPARMADILKALGMGIVLHSERDLAWSFAVVGSKRSAPAAMVVETADERRARLWREGGHL